MLLESEARIDVSLGESELLPPLTLSCSAEAAYRNQGLEPRHVGRLSELIGLSLSNNDLVLTAGASQGLLAAVLHSVRSLPTRPTKLVTFTPYYPGYQAIADLTNLRHVTLPIELTENSSQLLEQVARHRSEIFLVNTPHNPTGVEISMPIMRDMEDAVSQGGGQMIWDAAYRGVTHAREFLEQPPQNTLIVGSFSKLLGLAGERVGFITGPPEVTPSLARAQWGLALTPPASGISMVRVRLETLGPQHIGASRAAIIANRNDISALLYHFGAINTSEKGPFFWCVPPDDRSALMDLFVAHNIAVASGTPFGANQNAFRINLMISRSKAKRLVERLSQ